MGDVVAVEDLILKERQLEFMCEGKRWFDLMRTEADGVNNVIRVMDPVMRQRQIIYKVELTGFGDPGRIKFPIYYREFESTAFERFTKPALYRIMCVRLKIAQHEKEKDIYPYCRGLCSVRDLQGASW